MANPVIGRVFNLIASGAKVVKAKDVGYIVLDQQPKRHRRTKAEIEADKAKDKKHS